MKYYAYEGRKSLGSEALGTSDKLLFELKTDIGAVRKAIKYFGENCSVYKYTNFYNEDTFRKLY